MPVKEYRTGIEALSELEREIQVRERCYGKWITEGKISRTDARDRLDRLGSAIMIVRHALNEDPTLLDAPVTPCEPPTVTNEDGTAGDDVPF